MQNPNEFLPTLIEFEKWRNKNWYKLYERTKEYVDVLSTKFSTDYFNFTDDEILDHIYYADESLIFVFSEWDNNVETVTKLFVPTFIFEDKYFQQWQKDIANIKITKSGNLYSFAAKEYFVTMPNGDITSLWSPPWNEFTPLQEDYGALKHAIEMWQNETYKLPKCYFCKTENAQNVCQTEWYQVIVCNNCLTREEIK